MGISIIDLIENSWKTYKKDYRKIITPFAILGAFSLIIIALILGAYFFVLANIGYTGSSTSLGSNSQQIAELANIFSNLQSMLLPLLIGGILFLLIFGILSDMLYYSAWKPIHEIIQKKKVSSWKSNFGAQFKNVIKIWLAGILIILPVIIVSILLMLIPILMGNAAAGFIMIFGIIMLILVVMIIVGILSIFIPYNIIIKNMGIISSIKRSFKTVRNNVGTCLKFIIIWGIINVIISGVSSVIPCLGFILQIVLQYGVTMPIYVFAYIQLGDKLVK